MESELHEGRRSDDVARSVLLLHQVNTTSRCLLDCLSPELSIDRRLVM